MIKIYMMNVSGIDLENKKCYENLSARRLEKVKRLKNDTAKRQSIAAEILLNISMDDEVPGVKHPVIWEPDKNGKPYLIEYPQIYINITHSKNYAVCAISDTQVGVDIQYMREVDLSMAERFFSECEQEYIKSSPNKIDAFYEIWVRKESFVKAVGTGLNIPLDSFSVLSDTVKHIGETYEFRMHHVPDNQYKLCTCVRKNV